MTTLNKAGVRDWRKAAIGGGFDICRLDNHLIGGGLTIELSADLIERVAGLHNIFLAITVNLRGRLRLWCRQRDSGKAHQAEANGDSDE